MIWKLQIDLEKVSKIALFLIVKGKSGTVSEYKSNEIIDLLEKT